MVIGLCAASPALCILSVPPSGHTAESDGIIRSALKPATGESGGGPDFELDPQVPTRGRLILHTHGDEEAVERYEESFAVRDLFELERVLELLADRQVRLQRITISGHGSSSLSGVLADLTFADGEPAFTSANLDAAVQMRHGSSKYSEQDRERLAQLTRVVHLLSDCAENVSFFACRIGDGEKGAEFKTSFRKLSSRPAGYSADLRLPRGYVSWHKCNLFPRGTVPSVFNGIVQKKGF